jgi:hypothetical protein
VWFGVYKLAQSLNLSLTRRAKLTGSYHHDEHSQEQESILDHQAWVVAAADIHDTTGVDSANPSAAVSPVSDMRAIQQQHV